MNFFKEEKLYRVEIIKKCCALDAAQQTFGTNKYLPHAESFKKGDFGFIPVGTKGWVMKKFNKEYFLPDEDQEGLDLFISADQNNVLISYDKIKEYCKHI